MTDYLILLAYRIVDYPILIQLLKQTKLKLIYFKQFDIRGRRNDKNDKNSKKRKNVLGCA